MQDVYESILSWEDTAKLCLLGYGVGLDTHDGGYRYLERHITSIVKWSAKNPRKIIKYESWGFNFEPRNMKKIREAFDKVYMYRAHSRTREQYQLDCAFRVHWAMNLPVVNYEQAKEFFRAAYDVDFVVEPRIMDKKEYICRLMGTLVRNDFCGPFDTPLEAIRAGVREAIAQLPRLEFPVQDEEEVTDVDFEETRDKILEEHSGYGCQVGNNAY